MESKGSSGRGVVVLVVVLAVSAILGGLYGPSVRATAAGQNDMQDSVKSFTHVLSVVERNYADPVDADNLGRHAAGVQRRGAQHDLEQQGVQREPEGAWVRNSATQLLGHARLHAQQLLAPERARRHVRRQLPRHRSAADRYL